jgi:NADH-quinone oxidoreductase subunit B
LEQVYAWARKRSLSPMPLSLACCALEMDSAATSRYDAASFGMMSLRVSPRQADLMIVNGTVTMRMAPLLVRLYNQMAAPKYVIAIGACAISGGPFKEGYTVVPGVDRLIPVDVYVPGCPPRPEALLDGILKLHARIDKGTRALHAGQGDDLTKPSPGADPVSWRDLEGLVGSRDEEG